MVRPKLFYFLLMPCICTFSCAHGEEPWGKDEALVKGAVKKAPVVSYSPALYLICFHQQVLSEADGPRSHFVPSSSEYTRQAILYWGAGTGFLLGCDRLLRENNEEWLYRKKKIRCGYLKWDPVLRPGSEPK